MLIWLKMLQRNSPTPQSVRKNTLFTQKPTKCNLRGLMLSNCLNCLSDGKAGHCVDHLWIVTQFIRSCPVGKSVLLLRRQSEHSIFVTVHRMQVRDESPGTAHMQCWVMYIQGIRQLNGDLPERDWVSKSFLDVHWHKWNIIPAIDFWSSSAIWTWSIQFYFLNTECIRKCIFWTLNELLPKHLKFFFCVTSSSRCRTWFASWFLTPARRFLSEWEAQWTWQRSPGGRSSRCRPTNC